MIDFVFGLQKKLNTKIPIKPMQRCPSGLRCSPGKAVCEKSHQEFESLSLRQRKQKPCKKAFFVTLQAVLCNLAIKVKIWDL